MKFYKTSVLLTISGLLLLIFQSCGLEGDGAYTKDGTPLPDNLSKIYIEATTTEVREDDTTISITIYNRTASDIKGWTLSFDAVFSVLDIWNAILSNSTGGSLVITNEPWTDDIPAGGSLAFSLRCPGVLGSDSIQNCIVNDIPADIIIDGTVHQD